VTTAAETGTLRYQHSPDVLWRTVGGGVLLLVRANQQILSLVGSGSALWRVLASPRSLAESASILSEEYDVPAADIVRDIEPVLADLSSQGVLVAEMQDS
jgi:hypothetical protein